MILCVCVCVCLCVFCTSALERASGRGWFGLTACAGCGLRRGCGVWGVLCEEGALGWGEGQGTEAAGVCDARRPQSRQVHRAPRGELRRG